MIGELTAHLWQSTLFAVAAGLLTVAFRKNRAKVRYWLWFSASVKFFVPFALLMSLGGRLGWEPAVQKIATPAVSFVVEQLAAPFPEPVASLAVAAPQASDWVPVALLGLWAGGFLTLLALRFRGWLRIRRVVLASQPMDIAAAVEIRVSPGLLEPGVVGLLRPKLLLPEGIVDRLTPSQLKTVIAHELCHVRRRDNIFASIHMVVETICWFHPLVWWIGARLVEERERACDEEVLSLGGEPRTYADAILSVCRLYVESPLVCVSGVTGSNIRKRLEAIMINRRVLGLNRAKKFLLACAGVVALAGPVVVGVVIAVGHVPVIHAQSPVIAPPARHMDQSLIQPVPPAKQASIAVQAVPGAAIPALPQPAQAQTGQTAPAAAGGAIGYKDRRLVAMLFNLSTMTSDEQANARQRAVDYVHNPGTTTDLVAVMWADNGTVSVMQDFTDDRIVLEAAILKLGVGSGKSFVPTPDPGFAALQTAGKMLSAFPDKKSLLYFSATIIKAGADQAALLKALGALQNGNVAIFPIDVATNQQDAPTTYTGHAEDIAGVAPLISDLNSEVRANGGPAALAAIAGFPGAHTSLQVHLAPEASVLSVPLDTLSGTIDILAQFRTRPDTGPSATVADLRDNVQASAGVYQGRVTFPAGSYICRVLVREATTGRMFAETINFKVK